MNIIVNSYSKALGSTNQEIKNKQDKIRTAIRANLDDLGNNFVVETYNMNCTFEDYQMGRIGHSLEIFNFYSDEKAKNGQIYYTKYGTTMPYVGDGKLITDEEGNVIAEYKSNASEVTPMSQVNILIDAFKDENFDAFITILKEVNEIAIKPIKDMNSWSKTNNKEALLNILTSKFSETNRRLISQLQNSINSYENSINSYKREIVNYYKKMQTAMKQLEAERENNTKPTEKLQKDLDLLIKEERIEDVLIENSIFKIYTNVLYIHDNEDNVYYGGKYLIQIDMLNGSIKFYSNEGTGFKGYWSHHDPHPHVNGNSGNACLGNVDSTIAELCAQNELYALVLICLDFLESVNTSDSAGKKVYNWDRIIDGKRVSVEEIDDNMIRCPRCNDLIDIDDTTVVYEQIILGEDDIDYVDEHRVCHDCLDYDYTWCEEVDEYAREIINERDDEYEESEVF